MLRRKTRLKRASKKKKRKGKNKCQSKSKKVSGDAVEPSIDMEAANSQYSMARRFVQSILNWECPIPRKEYRDIADVILDRLSEQLGYRPIGNEDRKSQQMRILADVFACWISGILVEVSEKHRAELEEERLRKFREAELKAEREELEKEEEEEDEQDDVERKDEDDQDDDEDDDKDSDDDDEDEDDDNDDEDKSPQIVSDPVETEAQEDDVVVKEEPSEDKGDTDEEQEEIKKEEPEEELEEDMKSLNEEEVEEIEILEEELVEDDPEMSKVEQDEETAEFEDEDDSFLFIEDGVDAEQQTEIEEKKDEATEVEIEPKEQDVALEKMASRMSQVLQTEVPFVTFARIFETIYSMIESEEANYLDDPINNRIHRAIYEKFEWVIRHEDPVLLNERTKNVVDVIAGKIAKWLRRSLNEQQIKLLLDNPAMVESSEMRDWFKWVIGVADIVMNWSNWIKMISGEAIRIKEAEKMQREEWKNLTSKFEREALLWRRKYLEALQQQHHNNMTIPNGQVVKTGADGQNLRLSEKTLYNTNFEAISRVLA